jgi:hypothetical protein
VTTVAGILAGMEVMSLCGGANAGFKISR